MKMTLAILLLLFACCTNVIYAQEVNKKAITRQRTQHIDVHKIGFGIEGAFNHSYSILPKFYYEYGSNYGWYSINGGLKLNIENAVSEVSRDRITSITIPLFVGVNVNFIRWKHNCLYVGGETDFNFPVMARYYSSVNDKAGFDQELVNSYASLCARLGMKLKKWDLMLMYGYDLKPRYNQKYVYESASYDYEALKPILFDRTHFTLSIIYSLPL